MAIPVPLLEESLLHFFAVANRAYGRPTWTNDKRHSWEQWRYGHASLAVDGRDGEDQRGGQALSDCAIMDNYYVEEPVLRVDLGRHQRVRGVAVATWQGKGQGGKRKDRD